MGGPVSLFENAWVLLLPPTRDSDPLRSRVATARTSAECCCCCCCCCSRDACGAGDWGGGIIEEGGEEDGMIFW